MTQQPPPDLQPTPPRRPLISDDMAYILPMGVFLLILAAQQTLPGGVPLFYLLRTIAAAAALILLWKRYTKIHWNAVWLGFIVGVIGIVQWIAMQLWLEKHFELFRPSQDAFNPLMYFHSRAMLLSFYILRTAGAVLMVPVMEELFWRDYLWRQIIAPNDFRLASVGEWSPAACAIVCIAFGTVHGHWFPTAVVWGVMIATLLVYTKSLGACIVAHATTNFLLALYVIRYQAWSLW